MAQVVDQRVRRNDLLRKQGLGAALVAGVALLSMIVLLVVFAPLIAPADPNMPDLMAVRHPPSAANWFGTDAVGRDLLSRMLWGGQISLLVSGLGMIGSLSLGTLMGMLRVFGPQWIRSVIDRAIDIQLAFPYVILGIAVTSVMRPSLPVLVLLMVLAGWAEAARVVRAIALKERSKDYVRAAELIGASPLRIAVFHIFPGVAPSITVLAAMQMAAMIVFEATLSFLGMGVQPPTASWAGIMLEGKNYMTSSWWLTLLPGLAIMLSALSLVLIGEGLESRAQILRSREAEK